MNRVAAFVKAIRRPLCEIGIHAWSRWRESPCTGFTISGDLVQGVKHERRCDLCGMVDSYAKRLR